MFKTYLFYFIIPVNNDVDAIDKTMEGILNQTYPRDELRVLFIDNCSTDGSYNKVLGYIKDYPKLVSVYRMDQPTTMARLIKQASQYLRFSMVHFSIYLNPGDLVYPQFIENVIPIFHTNHEIWYVFSNADILLPDDTLHHQKPVFTDNCVFDKLVNYDLFFKAGIGAKVITVFRGNIKTDERLVDTEKRTDFHDWLSFSYPNKDKAAYLVESLGTVVMQKDDDTIFSLMTKAYSLKSQFYLTETSSGENERKLIDVDDMKVAYYSLAKNAVYLAKYNYIMGKEEEAQRCLLFAEMMCSDIIEDESYLQVKDISKVSKESREISIFPEIVSYCPPRDCFIF